MGSVPLFAAGWRATVGRFCIRRLTTRCVALELIVPLLLLPVAAKVDYALISAFGVQTDSHILAG